MGTQLREGRIQWVKDLDASTGNTAFPTASTTGVVVPSTLAESRAGNRVHVQARYSIASGTASLMLGLYGYAVSNTTTTAAIGWSYLGSFNSGSSMAAATSTWSPDASTILVSEVFTVSAANYERLATRQIAGGTGISTTTYIGFPVE
jgi:hypothetical protein